VKRTGIAVLSFLLSSLLLSQDYKIHHYIIPSSAVDAKSESFRTRGGLAEWTNNVSSGNSYTIDAGFWGSMVVKLLYVG
tara:strand:- start:591 stop:827 length:237 start_codon:yes stop_codon:yes gene_type:complete